jgi:hypothetical protein
LGNILVAGLCRSTQRYQQAIVKPGSSHAEGFPANRCANSPLLKPFLAILLSGVAILLGGCGNIEGSQPSLSPRHDNIRQPVLNEDNNSYQGLPEGASQQTFMN